MRSLIFAAVASILVGVGPALVAAQTNSQEGKGDAERPRRADPFGESPREALQRAADRRPPGRARERPQPGQTRLTFGLGVHA